MSLRASAALAAASIVGPGLPQMLHDQHGVPLAAAEVEIEAARNAPCRLDYRWIVALAQIETGHGTSGGAQVDPVTYRLTKPITSPASASGFTQFMPATGAGYGLTDDSGEFVDPLDARSFAKATAAKLCADGVETDPIGTLGTYNGGPGWRRYGESQAYVARAQEIFDSLPADDGSPVATGLPPAASGRSFGALAERGKMVAGTVGSAVIGGWVWVGGRLSGDQQRQWGKADDWLFGAGSAPTSSTSAVVDFARAQIGKPYVYGGSGPDVWDCSGLTLAAMALIGVRLPHDAAIQATMGSQVDRKDVRAGDLIFHFGDGVANGHVGIAVDAQQWVVAPRTGDVVKETDIPWEKVTAVRRFR